MPENKVIIVGDECVGKTSFVRRLRGKGFYENHIPTIGANIKEHNNYSFWDTASKEKYVGLRDGYYIGARHAIIVYDLTDVESFKNVFGWVVKLRKVVPNIKIHLVGNKSDRDDVKIKDNHIAIVLSKISYIISHTKVSCKDNINCVMPNFEDIPASS